MEISGNLAPVATLFYIQYVFLKCFLILLFLLTIHRLFFHIQCFVNKQGIHREKHRNAQNGNT